LIILFDIENFTHIDSMVWTVAVAVNAKYGGCIGWIKLINIYIYDIKMEYKNTALSIDQLQCMLV